MRRSVFAAALAVCLSGSPAGLALAQSRPRSAVHSGKPSAALAAPTSDGDWPTYGGDAGGMRFSAHTQINRANVSSLVAAWTFHTRVPGRKPVGADRRSNFEATPVLWNGTLYFDTAFDQVFALDAATGKQVWTFDPGVDRGGPIYIASARGVALWHNAQPGAGVCGAHRVYVATLDRRLIARDAVTGQECESFGVHGTVDLTAGMGLNGFQTGLYGFTSPPTVVGNVLVVGSSVGDNQAIDVASGAVRGFDAVTGRQLWTWEPLPWASRNTPRTGSGNAWSVLSADPARDLVFVPTGSPAVDFYGGLRPGDNRDADSLVALQASTGKRVWGFQFVHHDLWDYDTPSEPLLFDLQGRRPAVAMTTKTGMVFVFDRLTGEPLYPVVERPVPASDLPGEHAWPTQPFSTLPSLGPLSFGPQQIVMKNKADQEFCRKQLGALVNRGLFTPPSLKSTLLYPGSLGGANWGSPGLDPATGVLYVHVNSLAYALRQNTRTTANMRRALRLLPKVVSRNVVPESSAIRTPDGGEITEQLGTPYELYRTPITTAGGVPCAPQPFGALVAINLNSGRKLWTVAQGTMLPNEATGTLGVGGPAVTAGGLVFLGAASDPVLRAYDSGDGRLLWQGTLPAPAAATPMTYVANGRQFVVIAAGGSGMLGNAQSDAVVAFALPQTAGAGERHQSLRGKQERPR